MSDDLIKRLRSKTPNMVLGHAAMEEAADRIEQFEQERDDLMTALDKTMSVLDTQTQFLFQARTNLESVQAKLAKAVEALREQSCNCSSNCDWEAGDVCPSWTARTTLAELEVKE